LGIEIERITGSPWDKSFVRPSPSHPIDECGGTWLSSQVMQVTEIISRAAQGKESFQDSISIEKLGVMLHTCYPSYGRKH
jgi:hypothetical protein